MGTDRARRPIPPQRRPNGASSRHLRSQVLSKNHETNAGLLLRSRSSLTRSRLGSADRRRAFYAVLSRCILAVQVAQEIQQPAVILVVIAWQPQGIPGFVLLRQQSKSNSTQKPSSNHRPNTIGASPHFMQVWTLRTK